MDDSKRQLNPLDLLDAPDRWNGILDRAPHPDMDLEATLDLEEIRPRSLHPVRRVAIIAAALVIGLAATAALFVAFGRDGNQVTPAGPGPERIFFTSIMFPDEPGQIYSMAPDGSDVVQVTEPPASYSSVSVSPDGARMAYVMVDVKVPDSEGIYVANTDGSNATEIFRSSETPQSLIDLQWSPDGHRSASSTDRSHRPTGRTPRLTGDMRCGRSEPMDRPLTPSQRIKSRLSRGPRTAIRSP